MRVRVQQMLRRVLSPVLRMALDRVDLSDPWVTSEARIDPGRFGWGNRHRFGWFLDGPSEVTVKSVADICEWLSACEYRSDQDLFGEVDFWQHPRTFETLRAGDCEDFALWGWRKLLELGHDARFYVGHVDEATTGHAWVTLNDGAKRWILEGSARSGPQMLDLVGARSRYSPWFSIGGQLRYTLHDGYFLWLRRSLGPKPLPPGGFCRLAF